MLLPTFQALKFHGILGSYEQTFKNTLIHSEHPLYTRHEALSFEDTSLKLPLWTLMN